VDCNRGRRGGASTATSIFLSTERKIQRYTACEGWNMTGISTNIEKTLGKVNSFRMNENSLQ